MPGTYLVYTTKHGPFQVAIVQYPGIIKVLRTGRRSFFPIDGYAGHSRKEDGGIYIKKSKLSLCGASL